MSTTDQDYKEKLEVVDLGEGDLLQIDITEDKKISTKVQLIQGNTIWAADFLADIWNYRWRRQAFDATYLKGDRCFSFLVEIEGRDKLEHLAVTRMSRISNVQEVQRRASFRLPYSFDVYLRKWDGMADEENLKYERCKGMDISESGIGFTTEDNKWKTGDTIQCKFAIDDEEYVFDAKIMRRIVWLKDDVYIYRIGMRFNNHDERQLKKIRKFIFKQQVARMA